MAARQYKAQFRRDEAGGATVTSRKGRRLWMEPDLTDAEWKALGADLAREIQDALTARDLIIGEGNLVDYCDWLYEQGKTPADQQKPWGADLNTYLITESVDSLFARLVQAAFPKQEVVCTVGGWGEAAKKKAPLVEEYLDFTFRQEEPDAQLSVAMCFFQSLLEDAGILEVTEGYEVRATLEEIDIAPQLDEQGGVILDEKNQPIPQMDPQTGEPVKQLDPNAIAIKAKHRLLKPRLTGPQYDVISTRDFLFLPGHAKNRKGTWGYAVRIWPRVAELKEQAEGGIYKKEYVDQLGTTTDRQNTQSMEAHGIDVVPATDDTAEKEMWRVCFKRDLDGDSFEEWYCATVSVISNVMIRLVLDDFGRSRCLAAIPFPRRDSVYGYNFTANKIASIGEEHAALRNMASDRSALATNPPIKQIEGGLWDADVEPMGTGRVIKVRDHHEVEQMIIADVPTSNVELRRECFAAKERVTGVNDVSGSSVSGTTNSTATRDTLMAQAGAIRVETALDFLREFLTDLWDIRRLIHKRKLASEQDGGELPNGLADRLQYRGIEDTQTITADDLTGRFYYKPVGSVASADPARRRIESAQAMVGLGTLAQVCPPIGMALQSPAVGLAIMQTWARDNDVVDKQSFVNALREMVKAAAQQAQMQAQIQQMQMGGGDPLAALMGGGPPAMEPQEQEPAQVPEY